MTNETTVEAVAKAVRNEPAFIAACAFGVPSDALEQCADLIACAALAAIPEPGDEHHTMDELYAYRMAYHAHAAQGWLARGIPVVKSWKHSDGEPCFGGGWFIVSAQLPSGQVSNHYAAEHWDVFAVPEVETPPEYDGHTPAEALTRLLAIPEPATVGGVTREQIADIIQDEMGDFMGRYWCIADRVLALIEPVYLNGYYVGKTLAEEAASTPQTVGTVGTVEAQTVVYEWLTRRADEMHTGTPDETTTVQALLRELSALFPATTRDVGATVTLEQRITLINAFRSAYGRPTALADVKRAMDAALKLAGITVDRAASAKGDGK